MQSLEIIGFKRANLGKAESKQLRDAGNVPCVLYGGKDQIHFHAPAFLFRDLIYTSKVHTVDLTIGKEKFKCKLQDFQFDPVNDMLIHADFLLLDDKKEVKFEVPVKLTGTAVGVIKGGKLVPKLSKIKIKALPANLPDFLSVDISKLEVGKSVKVSDIKAENFTILNNMAIPLATVVTTRALRQEDPAPDAKDAKKK